MSVQSEVSVVPNDFDITPAVIQYIYGKNGIAGLLCEIQPVQFG